MNERFAAFIEQHVATYNVDPDGRPTAELSSFTSAMRPLIRLYGSTIAREFGPLALKVVRESMAGYLTWMAGLACNRLARCRSGSVFQPGRSADIATVPRSRGSSR